MKTGLMQRILALGAIILGVGLMVYGANSYLYERKYARAVADLNTLFSGTSDSSTRGESGSERLVFIDRVSTRGEVDMDVMRDTVPDDEIVRPGESDAVPNPNDKYVRPSTVAAEGDGSPEAPWSGLQSALDRLRPGDTLVVTGGFYKGPFVIAGNAIDGLRDDPITVQFTSNALLQGSDKSGSCEGGVLIVEKSHWVLSGLTITPQYCEMGLHVGSQVTELIVDTPHIFGGVGAGIIASHKARGISIFSPHLHQLGSLEGKDKATKALQRGRQDVSPSMSTVSALVLPNGGATVSGGKIHNHFGPILTLLDFTGQPLPRPEADAQLVEWSVAVIGGQAQWW